MKGRKRQEKRKFLSVLDMYLSVAISAYATATAFFFPYNAQHHVLLKLIIAIWTFLALHRGWFGVVLGQQHESHARLRSSL